MKITYSLPVPIQVRKSKYARHLSKKDSATAASQTVGVWSHGKWKKKSERHNTMKQYAKTIAAAALTIMPLACSTDEYMPADRTTETHAYTFRVAEFPAFGTAVKSVGTEDAGKTGWEDGDMLLLKISAETGDQYLSLRYGNGEWSIVESVEAIEGSAGITAWYAPSYQWTDGELVLKAGEAAGTQEFLTSSHNEDDLSDGIDIEFSGSREYSRIRVASIPGMDVRLSGGFIPVNEENPVGTSTIGTLTDKSGNAFFYGTWPDQAEMTFDAGGTEFRKTLAASVGNKSYVLKAGGSSFDETSNTIAIADAAGLTEFAEMVDGGNTALNAVLYDNIEVNAWTTVAKDYAGIFEGNGFCISGLTAPFAASVSGTIRNVKFTDVNISADGNGNCGAISDYLSGMIQSCAVTGSITATEKAAASDTGLGGMAGQAAGSAVIDNCYADIDIITNTDFATGGLVGVIKEAASGTGVTISNSTVEGTITSEVQVTKVGGILGRKTSTGNNFSSLIRGCEVSAVINIKGNGKYVGGILGSIQSSRGIGIEQCSFSGTVMAGRAVGGICGSGEYVTDCHVSGTVRALNDNDKSPAGGIAGAAQRDITRCIVEGAEIIGNTSNPNKVAGIAAFEGRDFAISDCAVINTVLSAGGFAIYGPDATTQTVTCTDTRWWNISYEDGSGYTASGTSQDGETFQTTPVQADFEAMGFDFGTVWRWNESSGAPELRDTGCSEDVKVVSETTASRS